jgi:ATP-binding protein involved in chromosome partitioning
MEQPVHNGLTMTSSSQGPSKDRILDELKRIAAPDGRGNIVSAGLISDIVIENGEVTFALSADPARLKTMEQLQAVVEKTVNGIPGVKRARVVLTAERQPGKAAAAAAPQAGRAAGVPGVKHLMPSHQARGAWANRPPPSILHWGLKSLGLKVAVLDADVYGPSMPKLFGLTGKPEASDADGKRMKPMSRYGVELMSIGFLVAEDTPMIWRGPMVMSALTQLLREDGME